MKIQELFENKQLAKDTVGKVSKYKGYGIQASDMSTKPNFFIVGQGSRQFSSIEAAKRYIDKNL